MVTEVVFGDEIVNPTDLRKHQKEWLEKAYTTPVTIRFGAKNLAIIRREKIGAIYKMLEFATKVITYSGEVKNGQEEKSKAFPWVKHLDNNEREQFFTELIETFQKSVDSDDWLAFENMLEDWKATAEAESNPETVKALQPKKKTDEYVRLDAK